MFYDGNVSAERKEEKKHIAKGKEKEKGKIHLAVRDNGEGAPQEDVPFLFDKGFTGKNGRSAAQDATGIGLYLCKRLCDKLDIGLCADSAGQGTTIQLFFHVNDFIHQVQG